MDPGYSRLLIDEWVLPDSHASEMAANMEINMMLNFNAIERTRSQWKVLLEHAGLQIVDVSGSSDDSEAIIKARIKPCFIS